LQSAVETEVPVQPVALRYVREGRPDRYAAYIDDDNLLMNLVRLTALPRSEVHVDFIAPLDSRHQSRESLAQAAHDRISAIVTQQPASPCPN
jgi:1-acyl-sn-glycerol-3-phosphate acyltransferase